METEMWFIPSHYNKHVNHHAFSSQSLPPRILTALRMRTEFELSSNLQGRVGIWLPVGLSDSLRDVLWFKSSWWSVTLTDNTLVNWKKKPKSATLRENPYLRKQNLTSHSKSLQIGIPCEFMVYFSYLFTNYYYYIECNNEKST